MSLNEDTVNSNRMEEQDDNWTLWHYRAGLFISNNNLIFSADYQYLCTQQAPADTLHCQGMHVYETGTVV